MLDFFAGSGTTGAAAVELDRKFLLVDQNSEAIEVMRSRLGGGTLGAEVDFVEFQANSDESQRKTARLKRSSAAPGVAPSVTRDEPAGPIVKRPEAINNLGAPDVGAGDHDIRELAEAILAAGYHLTSKEGTMSAEINNAALIAEAKNYEGDNDTARWPSLITDLALALEQSKRELEEERIGGIRSRRVNIDLHRVCAEAQQKIAAQTAMIDAALKITDDMRSGGWHLGKSVSEMGQKIYDILSGANTIGTSV